MPDATAPFGAPSPPPRPRWRAWLYAGAAAVLVLAVGGAWIVARDEGGGAGGAGGAACLAGLVGHLPADVAVVHGADLTRAREAGYDDGDTDAMVEGSIELGAGPDPVTLRVFQESAGRDELPYAPGDVDCWVAEHLAMAARGSFDPDAVESSDLVEMRVDGDVLTSGLDPEGGDPSPTLAAAVDVLEREDAVLFAVGMSDDDPAGLWSGLGLAAGDRWDLVAVWSFPDAAAAGDGEVAVRDALASGSGIPDLVAGDAAGALERDGAILTLRAPLAADTSDWRLPFVRFDAALFPAFGD